MRKKWRPPNDPMPQAKLIWQAVYAEPWPKGWRVEWVGFMRGASGLCRYGVKRILLSYGDAKARNKPSEVHDQRYLNALAMAFWYALTEQSEVRSTFYADGRRKDTVVRRHYDWWVRHASWLRLDKVRHSSLQRGAVETLLHEFVHLRNGPLLKHGKEFDRLVEWSRKRLSEARVDQLGAAGASEAENRS